MGQLQVVIFEANVVENEDWTRGKSRSEVLETRVNRWLIKNRDIKVFKIFYSDADSSLKITIFYYEA